MSSWALLDAACGYQYDASTASLSLAPRLGADSFRAFFITATAWGTASIAQEAGARVVRLQPVWGELELKTLILPHTGAAQVNAQVAEAAIPCTLQAEGDSARLTFAEPVRVPQDGRLAIRLL